MPSRSVEILRDRWGIPHIRGSSALDVAYGQGLATAQDRAWQLSYDGWRAQGRVAEHVGRAGLDWDVFARRATIAATAERTFGRLDDETRAFVAAYVDGVNDGLPTAPAPELDHLEVDAESWPEWMPLGVFLVQHILFATFTTKLWRARLVDRLGIGALDWLRLDAAAAPAIVGGRLTGPVPVDAPALEAVIGALGEDWLHAEADAGLDGLGGGLMLSGSNCFAVGGERTASGSPLVAGDPHRLHDLPNVYHQVHLVGPAFDVLGLAFVGVPGAPHFAHAGSVAWGITNAMGDYQDLFVEELERDGDRLTSRTTAGPAPVAVDEATIEIRGHQPVRVELLRTRNGPVVLPLAADRVVALRAPSLEDSTLGFDALLPLLRARTATDVEQAFARWVEPVNNVVVADADGRVRYRTAGTVPARHPANQWLPVPGWDESYAWRGLLEDASMPRWTPPPGGALVTANQRISDADSRIGVEAGDPSRALRIAELLADRAGLDVEQLAAIQADTETTSAGTWRGLLGSLGELSPAEAAVAAVLVGFDGRMAADSEAAAVFAAVRSALVSTVVDDPTFTDLVQHRDLPGFWDRWMSVAVRVEAGLESLLGHAETNPLGLDLRAAVRSALGQVARADRSGRTWGQAHRYRPAHALVGLVGATVFDPDRTVGPVPLAGDSRCVQANHSTPGVSDLSAMGPVARYVWDLGDRRRSRWIVPLGASGVPGDPHFADQLPFWSVGGSVPVVDDWDVLATGERATSGAEREPEGPG